MGIGYVDGWIKELYIPFTTNEYHFYNTWPLVESQGLEFLSVYFFNV